ERQRQAEEQRRREEEAERQRQAEEQRRREEEAERQRQAEEQRRREEEAERQRQAEEQRRREEEAERQSQAAEAASQGLDRAIEGESDAVANANQASEAANSFINLVRRAVEQAWVIPPGAGNGLTAIVQVRLGPSGELFAATITQGSGDNAFDRSAIQAVEAAAPFNELRQLPANAQRSFREFNLRFTPGDIR
ncbi:cell envelope integrity protein TolA, partial [Halomonas sp. NO4]|uniref:cell envelope integrity protein TolA n=1 Tax=Halomonas sp. NO4 TaxID=2484813 RepID=UPI001F09A653